QCDRRDLPPRVRRDNAFIELECAEYPTTFTGAIVFHGDVHLEQTHFVTSDLVRVIRSLRVCDPLGRAIKVGHLILGCHCEKQLECDRPFGKNRFAWVRMIWVRPYASNSVAAAGVIKANCKIAEGV